MNSEKREIQNLVNKKVSSQEHFLPHNVDAEKAVITAILIDPSLIWKAMESLDYKHFFIGMHAHIYKAMTALAKEDQAIDMISIDAKMKENQQAIPGGAIIYLSNLTYGVPGSSPKRLAQWIELLINDYLARMLISTCRIIEAKAFDRSNVISELIDSSAIDLFNLSNGEKKTGLVHVKKPIEISIERSEKAKETGNRIVGLKTGLSDLDEKTLGLEKQDYMIIAARPSMGKTALCLNIASDVARNSHGKVALFSLEMRKDLLTNRLLCADARVDLQRFRNGFISDAEKERINEARANLEMTRLYIDDNPDTSVPYMHSKCAALVSEDNTPLDLIIVDYIQIMFNDKNQRGDDRFKEVSQISNGLKRLARVFNCPLIALSQLSRAPEARKPPRPMMSDLRESGSLEQDADLVAFIYRDEYYHQTIENAGIGEIILSKNRNGPTGTIPVHWSSEYGVFSNLERSF